MNENKELHFVTETKKSLQRFQKYFFLFEELVKRDFKKKYKRTTLGMVWSVLSPLLTLLVMRLVFTHMFGRNTPHFTIYLFSGVIVMSFFREATKAGMSSLVGNAAVITKINLPKYLFLFSRVVSSFVNFCLTVVVYFIFCWIDHIDFGWHMLSLIIPILSLTIMNVGIGMILSVCFIFFRDTTYLYDVFLTLLNYLSAIFYDIKNVNEVYQRYFLLNPVYVVIKYFRVVTIDGMIPSLQYHFLMFGYAIVFFLIGFYLYRKYNHQFVYYF